MHNLDELQEVAVGELLGYFQAKEQSEDGFVRARLALGSLSAIARLKATIRAADTLQFHIVSLLAKEQDQLEQYMKVTLPHLMPATLLTKGRTSKS